jgi:hypothetical protein
MTRRLISAGPVEKCENGCGDQVRTATYEGGRPRVNTVSVDSDGTVRDGPGHHLTCDLKRGRR